MQCTDTDVFLQMSSRAFAYVSMFGSDVIGGCATSSPPQRLDEGGSGCGGATGTGRGLWCSTPWRSTSRGRCQHAGAVAALATEPCQPVVSLLRPHVTQYLVNMMLIALPHQLHTETSLCSLRIGSACLVDLVAIHGAGVGGRRRGEGCGDKRGERGMIYCRPGH